MASGFDSDDDFIFGVDLSNLDVSEIVEEGESSSPKKEDEHSQRKTPKYSTRITSLLSRSSFPALETPVAQVQYDELLTYATTVGAKLDGIVCIEDVYGGRGLAARKTFVAGDVIAILPRELRIGQTVACKRLGLPDDTPDLSALSLFILDLVSSKEKDEPFVHYAQCLPKKGCNGLFFSDEDVMHYGRFGEEYTTAINGIRKQAMSCKNYIHDVLADENCTDKDAATLLWAISIVQSRSHGFGTNRNRWLTPIFDFANHSPNANTKLEGDSEGRLGLRAVENIEAEEEITIDYQVSDDAKLVATYGFSLLHPHTIL